MRCAQCNSPFRFSIWIIQCGECKEQYCTKCMRRANGIYYCHKCTVLIMRPPDMSELMKLKAKDLQEYLSRHNIPTFGYVEKRELVDLLCNKNIPVKNTKTSTVLNKLLSNIESVFLNERGGNGSRATSPTSPTSQTPPPRPPRPPPPGLFSSTSTGNLNADSNGQSWTFQTAASAQSTTSVHDTTSPREAQSPLRPNAPPPPPAAPNPEPTTSSSASGGGSATGGGGGTLNYGFRPEFSTTSASTPESSPAPSPLPRRIPKLSDYQAVDDLNGITTKELKMLLTYNRVDYKGCVEKSELLEKAKILWKDHKQKRAAKILCEVKFPYEAQNKDELTICVGDIVTVLGQSGQDPGWWKGEVNGAIGVFPENFVSLLPDDESGSMDLLQLEFATQLSLLEVAPDAKSEPEPADLRPSAPAEILCVVKFPYQAESEAELTINVGDVVRVLGQDGQNPGWWKGELNGVIGVFPEDFVTLLPDESFNEEQKCRANPMRFFRFLASRLRSLIASPPPHQAADLRTPAPAPAYVTPAPELPQNLEDLCKLCMDAPLDCVLLECGHIATCINCGKQLAECPICRQYVTRIVRTFKA